MKKFNIYSIEEQMCRYNLTYEEASIKVLKIKEKRKNNSFNIYSVEEQMDKFNLTREEAIEKINKIKDVNIFSIKWQMKRFNLTENEAIEKINNIKKECKKTQLNKSEFEFNAMIPSKKEHWIKKGFSEEESSALINNIIKKAILNCQEYNNTIKNNPEIFKDKRTTNKEYWIKKGFKEEEAQLKVSERQKTFTLKKCIQKHGEIEGKKIHTERQNKWQKTLLKNGNLKAGFSKISQELFTYIIENYPDFEIKNVFFSSKNREFSIEKENGSFYIYDFTDIEKKKIIEYNGDQYHANPILYESSENPHPFRKDLTAKDIWIKDEEKKIIAEKNGFDILTIWDSEYKSNKEKTIQKCLVFLNS